MNLSSASGAADRPSARVIDVHTHMYSETWVDVVNASSKEHFWLDPKENMMMFRGLPIGRLVPSMLDYDLRIRNMDKAGVDVALISLTGPNVFWGTPSENMKAARAINDAFMAAAGKYDGRIRWMASLPFQNEADSLEELRRAKKNGAIGICTLTNIMGTPLTAPQFKAIWREIEAMQMPVFIHPMTPYVDGLGLNEYSLANTIGFTTDSSLCFARMIHSGFFDEFPKLNTIACHGGGALPFLIARFDRMWNVSRIASGTIRNPPSSYLKRIYFDAIVYDQKTLEFLIGQVGVERVLYGSDYPFNLGDMSGVLARVDALGSERANAIRSGNTLKLFDL
jgi:aminocarboxymuconate-semialdehyde decarboxylase